MQGLFEFDKDAVEFGSTPSLCRIATRYFGTA